MRQVLVDHARARLAARRDRRAETSLDAAAEVANPPSGRDPFLLRLNDALEALAREAPEKAHLIELRFFGGLTAEETAAVLNRSVHAIRHDLRFAQSWLRRAME